MLLQMKHLLHRGVNSRWQQTLSFPKLGVDEVTGMTDVDDKILQRASEAGVSPAVLARKYEASFLSDMKLLGVCSAFHALDAMCNTNLLNMGAIRMGSTLAHLWLLDSW